MSAQSPREYLEQKINTASPAQLHLMLIEGAIRFASMADQHYEANDADAAAEPLKRAMDVVSEMLAGVKHSTDEINVKLAELYRFVFTRLTMAYVNTDRVKLAEALRVLEADRVTWRAACEKVASRTASDKAPAPAAAATQPARTGGPHKPVALAPAAHPPAGGLSLEA
ncbi:MAG: flagellar export chaperone FliS [Planctomycetota bacterium]